MSDDLKNARVVLSAYDELVDDLRAENARLREALIEARGWVQDDVNADHRHRGQDVLDSIDAALNQ